MVIGVAKGEERGTPGQKEGVGVTHEVRRRELVLEGKREWTQITRGKVYGQQEANNRRLIWGMGNGRTEEGMC